LIHVDQRQATILIILHYSLLAVQCKVAHRTVSHSSGHDFPWNVTVRHLNCLIGVCERAKMLSKLRKRGETKGAT
jgi:hypothetical protein